MAAITGIYRKVISLFGLAHILLGIIGLYVITETVGSVGFLNNDAGTPFVVESFYAMTAINVLLIAAMGVAGFRLLYSGASAIAFSNLVCLIEIGYLLFLPILWLMPHLRTSLVSATGIGNVGLMVQGAVLYPVISLAVLSLCRRPSHVGTTPEVK
jgi:hypothetical protein